MGDTPIATASPPEPRVYHGMNWGGLRALYIREVRRLWKIGLQTLLAPLLTALLYMLVFVVAVGGSQPKVEGVTYGAFIAPGLIMMQILTSAFTNSSSSLLQAKINGLIGDLLTPPLSPGELVAGLTLGALTRATLIGAVAELAIWPFARYGFAHVWAIVYFSLGAGLIMGLLGVMTAIWAEKFDHHAALSNFIVAPITFLSGTFYLVSRLPEPFRTLARYNPFLYLIAGFRYGFTGRMDGSLTVAVVLTAVLAAALWAITWWIVASGYKLKT